MKLLLEEKVLIQLISYVSCMLKVFGVYAVIFGKAVAVILAVSDGRWSSMRKLPSGRSLELGMEQFGWFVAIESNLLSFLDGSQYAL